MIDGQVVQVLGSGAQSYRQRSGASVMLNACPRAPFRANVGAPVLRGARPVGPSCSATSRPRFVAFRLLQQWCGGRWGRRR